MPEGCCAQSLAVEYEAAAHRGVMPRREPVGDLGRPASLEARGGGPAPPGVGCEGRRRAPVAVNQLRTQLSTYSLRLRLVPH